MNIERVVATPVELAGVFAARVRTCTQAAREAQRRVSLVLPGGSVAQTFFPVLAEADLEWDRVDLFWGDERAVPPSHTESNYWLAETLLLPRLSIDRSLVHRMPADVTDLDLAARAYEGEIVRTLGERPHFDIVLLGVGPDGHVCSLFPGHQALDITSRLVVAVTDSPKPPPARLTLTLPALTGADIVVAAFGASKAAVVREALTQPQSQLPVARAARAGRTAIFLLDPDAAGL